MSEVGTPRGKAIADAMREHVERLEGRQERIGGYEGHIAMLLNRARADLLALQSRVEHRHEHWRIEGVVDRICEDLGAVETGYSLLLDEEDS